MKTLFLIGLGALACAPPSALGRSPSGPSQSEAGSRAPALQAAAERAGSEWSTPRTTPSTDASAAVGAAPQAPLGSAGASTGLACGALSCRAFANAAQAFRYVLESNPLVLGVGEAHVLAGFEHVRSSARRFSEELLPVLDGRASHLLVELLNPNPSCQITNRQVRQAHDPVTRAQSGENQNDYVELGRNARARGVEPFVLSPTCEEYQAILDAGDAAISQTLSSIATITRRMARAALLKNRAAGRERMVVAYGGALHNDLTPAPARADWSYGPGLAADTHGRYVELDLIVRELIKDNEAWRALPWYSQFDPALHGESSVVLRTAPNSYVLFFPKAKAQVTSEPAPPPTP